MLLKNNLAFVLKCNPWTLKQTLNLRKNTYITCSGKKDGVGAQTLAILSTMLFAQDAGLQYVHTPFREIAHNIGEDNYWEEKWERFFNLGYEEVQINEFDSKSIERVQLNSIINFSIASSNVLYTVSDCHKYTNLFPDKYTSLASKLKDKYYSFSKKNYPLHQTKNKINIAVHVRRGDVTNEGVTLGRFTDNLFISKLLSKLTKILNELDFDFSINLYSQGTLEDFINFSSDFNINYHLDECTFTTFHNMVNADILVMSKSTFSLIAALISDGIKLYEHSLFTYGSVPEWIQVDDSANFSETKLLKKSLFLKK